MSPAVSLGSIAVAAAWALLLGALGGVLTRLDGWYYALRQPGWKPPDWAFGPIWTTIFVAAGTAFVLAWNAPGITPRGRTLLLVAYGVNGLLNLAWSWLFFRRHRPDWSLVETGFLLLSILGLILALMPWSRLGALLILPFLVRVSAAWKLNYDVVRLTGPRGES